MNARMSPVQVMVNTMAVLFVLAMVWLLIQVRTIVILLILGIIFSAAIEPIVYRLRRRGFSRGQGIITVYALLLGLLGVGLYLVVPTLIRQGSALVEAIPTILTDLQTQALASQNDFIRTSGYRTLQRIEDAYLEIRQSPRIAGGQVVGVATSVLGLLFTVVTVLIVAFYWMTEKAIIKRVMLGIVPIAKRDRAHAIWDEIESKIGGWTRGQLILMASIGVISGIAYRILDLPFWLPLAIFAGITELIPFIGPFLGGGVAVIVALSDSWQKALIVVVFVLILQQIEGAILVPRVMRNAVGLTPLTVILAVLVGGVLLGPLGSILAIPISAAVQVLLQELLHLRDDMPDTIGVGATVPSAREAQQIIEQRHESPIPDLVKSAGTVPETQS